MTTLKSLVPSLELCRKLLDAGFPQETALVWTPDLHPLCRGQWYVSSVGFSDEDIAAPTFGEVWESIAKICRTWPGWDVRAATNRLVFEIRDYDRLGNLNYVPEMTFWKLDCGSWANAAAQLWLWCLENGYVKGLEGVHGVYLIDLEDPERTLRRRKVRRTMPEWESLGDGVLVYGRGTPEERKLSGWIEVTDYLNRLTETLLASRVVATERGEEIARLTQRLLKPKRG